MKPRSKTFRFAKVLVFHDRLTKARDAYEEAIAESMPEGTRVEWRHGRHTRTGRVIRTGCGRVLVRSTITENSVWICAARIAGIV
jgi:hypothetical protein